MGLQRVRPDWAPMHIARVPEEGEDWSGGTGVSVSGGWREFTDRKGLKKKGSLSVVCTFGSIPEPHSVDLSLNSIPKALRTLLWDRLEKEMATHSSTLAWRIPWREEPGRLQSMGSQRVRHDWATPLLLSLSLWDRQTGPCWCTRNTIQISPLRL